jgi:hypothetical protein
VPSVLTGAPFVKTTLTYTIQVVATGVDSLGNPTFSTSTGTLVAFVTPSKAAALQRLPGADVNVVVMKGELDDPLVFPASIGVGSVLSLTYAGQASELTLTLVTPNDLIGVEFGTYFQGDLRTV